jgi:hypothetical protein
MMAVTLCACPIALIVASMIALRAAVLAVDAPFPSIADR